MYDIILNSSIGFPNIGITFKNVGEFISVFGFKIAYYGIIIGIGILTGIFIAQWQAKRTGQSTELYLDFALYAVLFSVIGARIYYVVFEWELYKDNILSVFNTRNGGLAIYGGVLGALLTAFVYTRIKKISFWLLADTGILGLIIGQVIGRWGNFFNREAFGDYTNNLLAMRLPLTKVYNNNLTNKIIDNIQEIDGVQYIQVHPTFLYESMWNMALFIILYIYSVKKRFDGEIVLLYLFGYGLGRIWIEGLRTDQLIIKGLNLPASQLLAGIMIVVSLALIIIKTIKLKNNKNKSTNILDKQDNT